MSTRYKKVKFWMLSIGLSLVCSGLYAGASSEFILDNEGRYCSSNGNFALSVSGNGGIKIYGKGKELGYWNVGLYLNGKWTSAQSFENPIVKIDKKQGRITINSSFNSSGETKLFYSQQTQAKEGGIELTVSLSGSAGVNLAGYIGGYGPISHVTLKGGDYAGGSWTAGKDKAGGIPATVESEHPLFSCQGKEETASVFQQGSEIGFAIRNAKENGMTLMDARNKDGGGHLAFAVWLDKTPGKYTARQVFMPAYRTAQDIQMEMTRAKTRINFPPITERMGYFPAGYSLPAEVTILPSKETAGSYGAEFLLLDQTDREIMKKEMAFKVTEKDAGRVKLDFVTPDQRALYWMRISVKDKGGNLLVSKEFPFAVTAKLPDLKDIPATSPLGGQPLAGGRMPEGRFVGMKWDRFWDKETDWDTIEPAKGKFNWEGADRMVDEAIKAGNEILWCLCCTPNWASKMPLEKIYDAIAAQYPVSEKLKLKVSGAATDSPGYDTKRIPKLSPPKDIKDWEDFVRAVVRRYKTKVHYWQIWNEPWWDRKRNGKPVGDIILQLLEENGKVVGADGWGFSGTIEDYAALVKSASRIIHEEDPDGKVVAYGDYTVRDTASNEEFYKTGVGGYIDILSMHYFYLEYIHDRKNVGQNWYPNQVMVTATDNIVRDLDQAHFKHTGKHVPIWNTEEGWYKYSQTGRNTSRPLSQKECEELYGERAQRSTAIEYQAATGRAMISERLNAVWETESLLCSLGYGMGKVFVHCGHSVSVWGVGGKLPTEKGIAWAAMASVLSTSKEVKYSPMGNKELDAVTITDFSGKKTSVIWSHTDERKMSARIPAGKDGNFQGMDWLGNPIALKAEKGWLTVEVSEEPLYIRDLDLNGVFVSDKKFISIKTGDSALQVGKPYHGEIVVCNPYAGRSIEGVLEASVKPAGKVVVEGKIKLAPGEEKIIPYSLELEKGINECELEFVLREQGVEMGRVGMKRRVVSVPLPKAAQKITVDGSVGVWAGIAEHKVDTADRVLVGLETPVYESAPVRIWKGAEDLSFTVRNCWQEDGLYFLVEVKDNEVNPGPEPSFKWDCVEFFADLRDAEGQAKKEKTPGAVQFVVQPSLGDVPQECKISFAGDDGKYAKALFMGRKTKTGYVVEGKVEPAGIQLKEGMMIGLDVAVDDGREPNPKGETERKNQMVWLGTEDNYKDTSKWGKFYLGR